MDVRKMRNELLGKRLVAALESRNMEAYYVETKEEAVKKALELIPKYRYKDVLLYLDPPYVLSSRAGGLQYAKEMSDADHEKLLEVILDHPGPVVLSGYDSDLYRNMLKDWHRIELESRTQSHARRTEVIWTNYIPPQAEQLTFELD